jgi:YARHG domain
MDERITSTKQFCPQCGNATDLDAKFCKNCAFHLVKPDEQQAGFSLGRSSQSRSNFLVPLVVVIGLSGILIVGLLIGLATFRNQTSPENANAAVQSANTGFAFTEKAQRIEERIVIGESLIPADIEGLGLPELRILRNVNFAKYGRKYERPGLGDYFYTRSWYVPKDDYSDTLLTSTDKANVDLILAVEEVMKNSGNVSTGRFDENVSEPSANTDFGAGPQSTSDLDRQTVLRLVSGRMGRPVHVYLQNTSFQSKDYSALYRGMIEEKLLACEMKMWGDVQRFEKCNPGRRKTDLAMDPNVDKLGVVIGEIIETEVNGISKTSPTTAIADVVLSFQQNDNYDVFSKYSEAFMNWDTRTRTKRINLRLYDDGWRLETSSY